MKTNLQSGVTYCVKFYVIIMNTTPHGNDGFAIYFGSNLIDTITQCGKPLSFITPQVICTFGNPIIDTLGWTPITGTFVATGNEQYALIGIFKPNGMLTTPLINPTNLPLVYTDACIEDVSCLVLGNYDNILGNYDNIFENRGRALENNDNVNGFRLAKQVRRLNHIEI